MKKSLLLSRLIESYEGVGEREAVVGSFCALLELVRIQVIDVRQPEPGADIAIAIRPEHVGDIEEVVEETGLGDEEAFTGHADADEAVSGNGD